MAAIGRRKTNITDIDVLASVPDEFVGFRSVLIDCKTRRGESPISRALWLKGLMERLRVEQGICLLRAPRIESDHRYTAAQLGVTLVSEAEFPAYAAATEYPFDAPEAALIELERWDTFFAIGKHFPRLERAIRFSRSDFWMSENEAEACSRTIVVASAIRMELDPQRPEHLAVVADLTALFLHALARVVVRIFAAYLQPKERGELSQALLFLLYGGRATYEKLNRIRRLVVGSQAKTEQPVPAAPSHQPTLDLLSGGADERPMGAPDVAHSGEGAGSTTSGHLGPNLSLPEWDRFVQLVRQMLDAPLEVSRAPLLLREIAWGALSHGPGEREGVTSFARRLAEASPQGARFAVLGLDYLYRAARLPREFGHTLTSRLLEAQTRL
ncbi:MAG: hypothetical protein ACREKS_13805 [Candidatus Rokuibacteriota bacterium]